MARTTRETLCKKGFVVQRKNVKIFSRFPHNNDLNRPPPGTNPGPLCGCQQAMAKQKAYPQVHVHFLGEPL